jgi:hypothetical protein
MDKGEMAMQGVHEAPGGLVDTRAGEGSIQFNSIQFNSIQIHT